MTRIETLMTTPNPFLTDGGLETTLFFLDGFEAPAFAAIVLLDDPAARAAMTRYFDRFLATAEAARTGFVLDTCTWRGATVWAPHLGRDVADMVRLNREAVRLAKGLRARWQDRVAPILVNGVVGPAGDGYRPGTWLTPDEAEALHAPQIGVLAEEGVDLVSAITMTHPGEAVGIVRAAQAAGLPVVVSFTVETDGRLPGGESIGEAIAATDGATGAAPLYYMVNCAHPEHFRDALDAGADWIGRIGGVRANASRLSHAELDAATELDDGDPEEFGRLHGELARLLPGLRVVGGCCGTDHRHVAHVSHHLHAGVAA